MTTRVLENQPEPPLRDFAPFAPCPMEIRAVPQGCPVCQGTVFVIVDDDWGHEDIHREGHCNHCGVLERISADDEPLLRFALFQLPQAAQPVMPQSAALATPLHDAQDKPRSGSSVVPDEPSSA